MDISFDSARNEKNVLVRGVPFQLAARFVWDGALIVEDLRKDYGERRFQALGLIGNQLYVMVFTPRARKAHVISLRKANKREVKRYEAQA
ncbi:MAG: BrnT family toxin [Steroidobacteraceae bacterium]